MLDRYGFSKEAAAVTDWLALPVGYGEETFHSTDSGQGSWYDHSPAGLSERVRFLATRKFLVLEDGHVVPEEFFERDHWPEMSSCGGYFGTRHAAKALAWVICNREDLPTVEDVLQDWAVELSEAACTCANLSGGMRIEVAYDGNDDNCYRQTRLEEKELVLESTWINIRVAKDEYSVLCELLRTPILPWYEERPTPIVGRKVPSLQKVLEAMEKERVAGAREQLRGIFGDEVDELSDKDVLELVAELG